MAEAVTVTRLAQAARFSIRGGDAALASLGQACGVEFPLEACRSAGGDSAAALWLGPDEWLLIAESPDAEALHARMTEALAGAPASIVDISDRQIGINVAGPKAAETLNAFNALDLDESAFPVGMCSRTLFGKAEIVLWRTGTEAFRMEVWRSFAPYVLGCLGEACREYGVVVGS